MINRLKNILLIAILFSACTVPQKYQKNKPFVFKNSIELNGGKFSKDERSSLKQKMYTLLNDSAKTVITDYLFLYHTLQSPAVYDSSYAAISAKNMKNTLLHLGYYQAKSNFNADTQNKKAFVIRKWLPRIERQQRVHVKYLIEAGHPTLIDTFSYKLKKPELQELAVTTQKASLIEEGKPVTKANILGEISRLVELYRNNGYYKFTSDELRMRGDTSIAALTSVSDDPFETIRLLEEANRKRDSPTVKLALVINPESDSSRLIKYYIDNIYIYPDYTGDENTAGNKYIQDTLRNASILRYHNKIVKNKFLLSNLFLKKGDLYRQEDYSRTVSNFSRTGVWQNVNVQMVERKDSIGKLDMIIQLAPGKKYGFESNIEASYSTNSNSNNVNLANSGNLLGLSGNISLQNRNAGRQGIKVTHALRAGVELNLNVRPSSGNFINSSEISYNNTIAVPKLLFPFNEIKAFNKLYSKQTFFNTSVTNTNRIGLFKLNSFGFALGYEFNIKPNQTLTIKPLNVEYSRLYNRSFSFDSTLNKNPYLRYSFNTALVMGSTIGYNVTNSAKNSKLITTFKATFEESGALLYFAFPLDKVGLLNKDLKKFVKLDAEQTWTWTYAKSVVAIHAFGGVGIPIGKSDTTLPFFKQYFGGGPNSMRAWPIRGIGPGSKSLSPYDERGFNDRTGDIRLELNAEYRRDLWQMIPNTLTLKWALFADIGNVWNFKNTQPDGSYDSTQFRFKNLYHDLGMNVGTGFRLDFNYVILRFDFGFRVKRPELSENGGWKLPSIGFDDLWGKLFQKGKNDEYRKWRYENFNFTIGLNYPF